MKFSILVVNYNTEQHIHQLLSGLSEQNLNPACWQVLIVNNVQNTLLDEVTHCFNEKINVKIIASPQNLGFGRAMNLAAEYAIGEHLLITNPDIIMDNKYFLGGFLQVLQQNPHYGVATCQLLDDNGEDKSEFYDFEFHERLEALGSTAWFSGAFLAIRKETYQHIKGFDPDFFMYCEDEDLCLRVQRLGLPLLKVNELSLQHKGGASEPVKDYDFFYRWFRSQLLFAYKHFDETKFNRLLQNLQKKSIKKLKVYQRASLLPITRYKTKQYQWQAMLDVVQKTQKQGTNWLYFKPSMKEK